MAEKDLQKRIELNRRHREWRKRNHALRREKEKARHKKLQENNPKYRETKLKNMQRWKEQNRERFIQYQRAYYQKRREAKLLKQNDNI